MYPGENRHRPHNAYPGQQPPPPPGGYYGGPPQPQPPPPPPPPHGGYDVYNGYGGYQPPPQQQQPPPPQQGYGGYSAPPPSGPGYNQYQSQPSYGGGPTHDYRSQPSYGSGGQGGYQPPTGQYPPSNYHTGSVGVNPMQAPSFPPPSGPSPHRPPTEAQHYGPQFQGQGGAQQPFFQYSQCTGKKKALCIGINYRGTSSELRGCINDAQNVQRFLCQRYGYRPEDIVMLTDDATNPRQIPTRANMIAAMQWLVQGAQPNDSLFFHYSGHGGQTKDLDGDEDDAIDEVVYPLDHKTAGHIVDDDIHTLLVKPLPAGCRLTAIFDSCHSGTAMDLPYVYSTEGKIKEPNLLAEAGQGLMSAGLSYLKGDKGGMLTGLMGLGKQVMNQNSGAAEKTKQTKTSPADVISWSGCKDSQTSADTSEAGKATGAMSYAFIAALTKYPQQSYLQLLNSIRDELKGRYSQKPQLSASHPMDVNLLFIC